MAWEHIITADAHDHTVFDVMGSTSSFNFSRSTEYKRTGTRSFRLYNTGQFARLNVTPADTKYVAFACAGFPVSSGAAEARFDVREGTTVHVRLTFNNQNNEIKLYRSTSTLLATWTGFTPMQFSDIKIVIADSGGEVTIRDNNGDEVGTFSGNTRNGASGVIDNLIFMSGGIWYAYYDDIAVRTDDWCGPGGNHVLTVTGNGDDTEWTPSVGAAWECVDEIPGTFLDYISTDAATPNTKATFVASNLDASLVTVDAVAVYASVRLSEAGSGNARAIVKSGSSYGNGAIISVDTTPKWVKGLFSANPATSGPWNNSSVNNIQVGVETG